MQLLNLYTASSMGMHRFYVGAMLLGIPYRSQNRSALTGRTRTAQKAALIEPFSVSSGKHQSPRHFSG